MSCETEHGTQTAATLVYFPTQGDVCVENHEHVSRGDYIYQTIVEFWQKKQKKTKQRKTVGNLTCNVFSGGRS